MKIKFTREELCAIQDYASVMLNNPCVGCPEKECCGCQEHTDFKLINKEVIEEYNKISSSIPELNSLKENIANAFINTARSRKAFFEAEQNLKNAEDMLSGIIDEVSDSSYRLEKLRNK